MKNDDLKSLSMDDPVLVASVERALEPYKNLLSPGMLEHFRSEALLLLAGHPYSVALVMAIKDPKAVTQSDDRPLAPGPEEEPARSSGNGRGEP